MCLHPEVVVTSSDPASLARDYFDRHSLRLLMNVHESWLKPNNLRGLLQITCIQKLELHHLILHHLLATTLTGMQLQRLRILRLLMIVQEFWMKPNNLRSSLQIIRIQKFKLHYLILHHLVRMLLILIEMLLLLK